MTAGEIAASIVRVKARLAELEGTAMDSMSIAGRAAHMRSIEEFQNRLDYLERRLADVSGNRPMTVRFQKPL